MSWLELLMLSNEIVAGFTSMLDSGVAGVVQLLVQVTVNVTGTSCVEVAPFVGSFNVLPAKVTIAL